MIYRTIHAPCPTCSGLVVGRSDKRFCSLKCKNEHHRRARLQTKSRIENTTARLQRNLTLMDGIIGPKAVGMSIHKEELFKRGFELYTCSKAFEDGNSLVYELGEYLYTVHKNGIVTIRRVQEVGEYMPGFFERYLIDYPENWVVNGSTQSTEILKSQGRWNTLYPIKNG